MNNMKLLILSDVMSRSGAGNAISKISTLCQISGNVMVRHISSESLPSVLSFVRIIFAKADFEYRRILISKNTKYFSFILRGFINLRILYHFLRVTSFKPDAVLIGWANRSFLDFTSLHLFDNARIIIRLSDEWLFTGGCHFIEDCSEVHSQCRECPQLRNQYNSDLSHLLQRKLTILRSIKNLTIVTPTAYLQSYLARLYPDLSNRFYYIPTSVDTSSLYPSACEDMHPSCYNYSTEKPYFTFAASSPYEDTRKNLAHAINVVSRLNSLGYQIVLIVIGSLPKTCLNLNDSISDIITNTGYISSYSELNRIYSLSSLHLTTSTSDNLPNTALEALACGLPLASHAVGGLPEITHHERNGLLFDNLDIQHWTISIAHYLDNIENQRPNYSAYSRRLAETRYSERSIASQWHEALFNQSNGNLRSD